MSHNLFGERFFVREKPAWHNIGTVFPADANISLKQAVANVVNYSIIETPVYAQVNGEFILIPNRKALVRTPVNDNPFHLPLEVVSSAYMKVDEFHLADIFDDISQKWKVETAGVLNNGQTLFATLDAGMVDIKGDVIHQYFLLTDNKDRRTSTIIAYTPIRIVCYNTLTTGLAQATLRLNVPHRGNNMNKLINVAQTIREMQNTASNTNALFNNMAETPLSLKEFKEKLFKIYPDPAQEAVIEVTNEFFRLKEKAEAHRQAAIELFVKFNDEFSNIAATKWAAWNAITELEDWKAGRSGRDRSVVFGQRANTKAQALSILLSS